VELDSLKVRDPAFNEDLISKEQRDMLMFFAPPTADRRRRCMVEYLIWAMAYTKSCEKKPPGFSQMRFFMLHMYSLLCTAHYANMT
jgi:hypothetical protein